MIVAHQPSLSGLFHHRRKEQPPHLVLHQPLAVLAENRGIEAFFNQLHVQKPAKQQIVTQLLAKLPLASHRVKGDQQQRLQYLLRGHRRPSHLRIHPVKNLRQFHKLSIRHCFDFSQRMIGRNAPLYRDQSQHARLSVLRPAPIAEHPVLQQGDYWVYQRGNLTKTKTTTLRTNMGFPLWIGKTWSYEGQGLPRGSNPATSKENRAPTRVDCEAVAFNQVSVVAGTFAAF